MTNKSLLLVAHGSRREQSNNEVRQVTAMLKDRVGDRFVAVECAFLELAEPSIPDGIECCVRQGGEVVEVIPYFLSAGRHVAEDIPEQVDIKRREYPDIDIRITRYLGAAEAIPEVLLSLLDGKS
jgi:sirohydrochlorin ferrochelatase